MRALVIDDEPNSRSTLALCLAQLGCFVAEAATGGAAVEALRARRFDLALLDLRLGPEDGLAVLPQLLALRPDLEVVVVTAYPTVDSAVEAMRRGAKDYLPKPFSPAQIRRVVERTRERRIVDERVASLEPELHDEAPAFRLDAASPRMRSAIEMVRRAAGHDVPVLLRGEPGTGKGALARALHEQSARRDGPFVVVRCAATPEERLPVELFGRAGAADHGATGALERADGGTLLLDLAGALAVSVQAPLLRFLHERRFGRARGTAARAGDVRLVVATELDLEAEVAAGRLRRELSDRLSVMEIIVPPLRDRVEDVLPLSRELVASFARRARRSPPALSPDAEEVLVAWAWPGNVRELRNVIERALILTPGDVIDPEVFPERMRGPGTADGSPVPGGDFTAEEVEREHVNRVVARTATLAQASRILGVDVTTLWRKRKKWAR